MNCKYVGIIAGLAAGLACAPHAMCQDAITGMAGLTAWYRADSVTQDTNHVLTTLKDCSGQAHAIIPGPKAPTVVTNALNGQPVLRFNGSESPLIDDQLDWSADGFTVFVVAAFDTVPDKPVFNDQRIETPSQALVSDGGSAGLALGLNWNGRPGAAGGISRPDPDRSYDAPYPNEQASDLLVAAKQYYAFTYASTKGKHNDKANAWDCTLAVSVFANGTPSIMTTPFISMQQMNSGKKLQLGTADGTCPFRGDIAEILIFNRELAETERGTVVAYLQNKYALPDTAKRLPADPVQFTPAFKNRSYWFRDTVTVEMSTPTAGGEIHYTTDGTTPTMTSPRYTAPIQLAATTTVMAQTFADGRDASPVQTAMFEKIGKTPVTANKLPGGWKYSWGDEFTGPEIDASKWGYEIGYIRNSEAQYYADRTENSRIDNGNLLIQGRHDNWNGHEYTSASRSTENKVTLTYGRYELRAKIDTRSGSWPAWWLWSRPDAKGWPKEGEIDMMEYYRGKCLFNVVDGNGVFDTKTRRIAALGGDRWAAEFHVWTMDWDQDKIDLYLDGVLMSHFLVDRANGTGPNGANPYRNPQTKKMVLNQALGGSCGGQLNPKDAPFEFRVDWLRVHTWSNEPAYTLTINAGTGSGPYVVGTRASLTAHMPPPGYVFDTWVVNGKTPIDDPHNPATTITMPAADVIVTATYVKK